MLEYFHFLASPALIDELLTAQIIFKAGAFAKWLPNQIYSVLFLSTSITLVLSCIFPVKMVLLEVFKQKDSRSCKWNFLASFILCFIVAGISLAIDKTSLAVRLIGVSFYPFMCFILPAVFYLSLGYAKASSKIVYFSAWGLLLFTIYFIASGILELLA